MKQFKLTAFMLLMLLSVTFISCNDDDDFDDFGITENVIKFDGETYRITKAEQEYYGEPRNGISNVDLWLYAGSHELYFELFMPTSTNLVSGTYTRSSSIQEMIYSHDSDFYLSGEGNLDITSGTVRISRDGNTYAIDIDVICDGQKLTATYKGKLDYYDYSDDED